MDLKSAYGGAINPVPRMFQHANQAVYASLFPVLIVVLILVRSEKYDHELLRLSS